jgi:large subunit ribosomal protein L13
MKSFQPTEPESRAWILVDATDRPVGRLAAAIAGALRGKDKPTYSPQVDTGDFVVVVNAEKVKLTGRKERKKMYSRYSGYRSGLKDIPAEAMRARHPERIVELAVRGMLPKNKLARNALRRLKVYAGGEHPHAAQMPKKVDPA